MATPSDTATRGPWAADITRFRNRVVTTQGADICDVGTPEDAMFIAAARSGWPDALESVARALVEVDAVKVERDTAENKHRADMAATTAKLAAALVERDTAGKRLVARDLSMKAMAARMEVVEAELARLRPLAEAVSRWAKHRYSPELMASWDVYLASGKE